MQISSGNVISTKIPQNLVLLEMVVKLTGCALRDTRMQAASDGNDCADACVLHGVIC